MGYLERIRALREDRDLPQRAIAEYLGVGQRTYADYELGKTGIPLDRMIALARYYDVCMDYLCGVSQLRRPFPRR